MQKPSLEKEYEFMTPSERRILSAIGSQLKTNRYPMEMINESLLPKNKHTVALPGTGKAALGLETDIVQQLICHNASSVVIFDCKADMTLLQDVRATAKGLGRKFKQFSNP
jgi:hypothetical protein